MAASCACARGIVTRTYTIYKSASWSHIFVTSVSGSNESERCKISNRNISHLGRILNQEEAVFEDPKMPNNQYNLHHNVVAGKNGPYDVINNFYVT